MKRTLSLVLILCAFLCACTGKTEFSESFICGEAEAYAVCEEGLADGKCRQREML